MDTGGDANEPGCGSAAGNRSRDAERKEDLKTSMAKQSTVMVLANRMAREIIANQTQARLTIGFDASLIAANEVFHLGPGRAAAFIQAWWRAIDELAGMYVDDADGNHDNEISYSKGTRDEVIRRIVGEENFIPFDQAYGQAYIDELKRVRVRIPQGETASGA